MKILKKSSSIMDLERFKAHYMWGTWTIMKEKTYVKISAISFEIMTVF